MTNRFIGYGRQSISPEDVEAVVEALGNDHLTQGATIDRFEAALAEYVGARYAVAVSNGTAALHLACLGAGLEKGKRALTQAITFVATINAARYCQGDVDAVDIDAVTLGMSAEGLKQALGHAPDISVILPVYMGGLASGTSAIRHLASSRTVIEDACHAFGGQHEDGAMVGSCRHADMACFSFHPVKSITTGEGGAITTNDAQLARRLRMLRNHGIERDPDRFCSPEIGLDNRQPNPWYYEQQFLGFNYRMTDLQAALGLSQLKRVDKFIARRRELARFYDEGLARERHAHPLQSGPSERRRSAHHLYLLDIDFQAVGKSRAKVMGELRLRGIGTQVHYIPLYRQPFHRGLGSAEEFPAAERYYQRCLSLPIYPDLTDEDAQRVVAEVREVLNG